MPCACGRAFVPDLDMYVAHVQTPEHLRWRINVVERGTEMTLHESMEELFGLSMGRLKRELAPSNPARAADAEMVYEQMKARQRATVRRVA